MCVCVYIHVCVCVYNEIEREREYASLQRFSSYKETAENITNAYKKGAETAEVCPCPRGVCPSPYYINTRRQSKGRQKLRQSHHHILPPTPLPPLSPSPSIDMPSSQYTQELYTCKEHNIIKKSQDKIFINPLPPHTHPPSAAVRAN